MVRYFTIPYKYVTLELEINKHMQQVGNTFQAFVLYILREAENILFKL